VVETHFDVKGVLQSDEELHDLEISPQTAVYSTAVTFVMVVPTSTSYTEPSADSALLTEVSAKIKMVAYMKSFIDFNINFKYGGYVLIYDEFYMIILFSDNGIK